MTSTTIHTPLSDDEYDELDTLLAAPAFRGRAMAVDSLEGYLAAIAIGPNPIQPSRWLSQVWDMSGEPPDLTEVSAEHARRVMELVLRHHHYMVEWMGKDPGSLEPIYACGPQWRAGAWCRGFLLGTRLDGAAWEPLRAAQPSWFQPLQDALENDGDGDGVVPAVLKMHAHWQPQQAGAGRNIKQPATRETPKVGRNDPCPCGSGKKFKKCCDT